MIGIYMYENKKDKKRYIGQSINIQKRKNEHLHGCKNTSKFDNFLRKIGEDCFVFSILEECSKEELDERERYWIKYYDTQNPEKGYNLTEGGQSQRGEENIQAKLTEDKVFEIIKLLEENKLNDSEIAEIYHVHRNTINNINRCITWAGSHTYEKNIRKEYSLKNFKKGEKAGENNPTSKITEEKARQIIYKLERESTSCPKIAESLGVSLYIVEDIKRCRTWTYLHNYKKNIRKEYREGMINYED